MTNEKNLTFGKDRLFCHNNNIIKSFNHQLQQIGMKRVHDRGVPNFLTLHVSLLEKSISLSQESEWNNPIYNVTSTNDWISTYTHCSLKKNFQPKISLPFPMHNNTRFWWMGTKSFWQTWTNSREWFETLYIPVFFLAQKAEY